jgi:hypothetical protein
MSDFVLTTNFMFTCETVGIDFFGDGNGESFSEAQLELDKHEAIVVFCKSTHDELNIGLYNHEEANEDQMRELKRNGLSKILVITRSDVDYVLDLKKIGRENEDDIKYVRTDQKEVSVTRCSFWSYFQ